MPQPLNIILTPVGSAGDVHPFIGIGRELRRRGHQVTVITNDLFESAVQRAGLAFLEAGTAKEFEDTITHPDLWNLRKGLRFILRMTATGMQRVYDRVAQAHQPGRTVLVTHPLAFGARLFEDQFDVPGVTLNMAPAGFRTVHKLPTFLPGHDFNWLPRTMKRAAWWWLDRVMVDPHIAPQVNALRRQHGLPKVGRLFERWVFSPGGVVALFPRWFGEPQPDWPTPLCLAGFPLFDDGIEHAGDPRLEKFLDAGSPPIAVTPGSANRQAGAFFTAALEAAGRLERRALLLTRYPEQLPRELPEWALHVSYAPFSHVLPRCCAFVHHGGIGTCAQGLSRGVPQLVMPLGFDQPDNAARLKRLNVGRWVTPGRFDGPRVATALDELLTTPAIAEACRHWARQVDGPGAVAQTCDFIEAAHRRA